MCSIDLGDFTYEANRHDRAAVAVSLWVDARAALDRGGRRQLRAAAPSHARPLPRLWPYPGARAGALQVVHPTHGPILVDAPFGHEGPANVGAVFGAVLRGAGLRFDQNWSVIPRIEQLGFRPSEVHHILMTHLHWDHTGGMKELGHAHFHITRTEWEYVDHLTPLKALRNGYQLDDFRAMRSRVELIDDPLPLAEDPTGLDLFGDGSVCAVGLPGHTLGHVGYRFRFADDTEIFYVGDAAFTNEHIGDRRPLGVFCRAAAFSVDQTLETLRSLRLYHDEHPDEQMICAHDFGWGERCLEGPTPLHRVE